MPGAHDLLRLSLATIRRAPERPFIARADRIHRIPEFCGNPRVRGVLQHAGGLAVFDLPADFGAELEVVTLVVDGPRAVGLKQNSVIGR